MTDLNSVVEIGRLTRDISERDFAYTTTGKARLNLSIAVNRSEKRGGEWADKVSFFDVTVWGKTAENIKPYLHKGKQIAVDGYLDQQRWEKDGVRIQQGLYHREQCTVARRQRSAGSGTADSPARTSGRLFGRRRRRLSRRYTVLTGGRHERHKRSCKGLRITSPPA